MAWFFSPLRNRLKGKKVPRAPHAERIIQFEWVDPESKAPRFELAVDSATGAVERSGDLFNIRSAPPLPVAGRPESAGSAPEQPEPPTVSEYHEARRQSGELTPEPAASLDPVLENLRKSGRFRLNRRLI